MDDFMLDAPARAIRDKVREFVRDEVDPEYLRRMDRDEIRYPRELYEAYARHGLLGLRFPKTYGGQEMSWVAECAAMEGIGVLGMAAGCSFVMRRSSGKPWSPTHRGAEAALSETDAGRPSRRGRGSHRAARRVDFFGATSRAEDHGDHFVVRGMKRFVVGAEGADFFLAYVRTNLSENAARTSASAPCSSIAVRCAGQVSVRPDGIARRWTGRSCSRDVHVPKANLIGPLHGGASCSTP